MTPPKTFGSANVKPPVTDTRGKYVTTQRIYKNAGGDLSLEAEGSLAYSVGKVVSDVNDQKAIKALVKKDAGSAPENKDAGAAPENKAAKQSKGKRSRK